MPDLTPSPGADDTKASLELLYHISRELASDLDIQTVLRRVLLMSIEAVGSLNGSIIILDSGGKAIHSAIIHSDKILDKNTRTMEKILQKGLAGWVAKNRETVIVQDTSLDERWLKRPDDAPDRTGSKSAACVPLMAREQLVGIMTLVHPEPGKFKKEHGALLQTIADQSGISILNARLYEESRRREHAMAALAESAMAITDSVGTDDVLNRVLQQVQQALSVTAVSLALLEPDQKHIVYRAAAGKISKNLIGTKKRKGEGICGFVAQTGQRLIIADTSQDDRYDPSIENLIGFQVQAIICVPIFAQGDIIGTLETYNPTNGQFNADDIVVLAGIGSMAGSVIRNAQLFERLEAAHKRFRDLFDDSIDMILVTDKTGTILQSNRQAKAIINQASGNYPANNIFDLHQLPDETDFNSTLVRLEQGEMVTYESKLDTLEGSKWFEVYLRVIQLEDESLLQWLLHDISERKEMDSLRDDLISMIYHDLRSPLANITYSLDMMGMLMEENASDQAQPLIEVANRASARIQRLTSALLDIPMLEAGQPLKNRVYITAKDLVKAAHTEILPIIKIKSQVFSLELGSDDTSVLVDRDIITRVLINLMENAVKYTQSEGHISAGIQKGESRVLFWVEDEGPGIPEDKKQVIFNKYSQLENTGMGYGLGLSFCRLAVEAHGGHISVENIEDKGARFCFALPIQTPGQDSTENFQSKPSE